MQISKNYTNKINQKVASEMKMFTNQECILVKRIIDKNSEYSKEGKCHLNVQHMVKNYGGEQIYGWLLTRNKQLINKCGVWHWMFHSVWKNKDGELIDVSKDTNYEGQEFSTFWLDANRKADLDEGLFYNSIVSFENVEFAKRNLGYLESDSKNGEIFWTNNKISHFKKIDEHNGQYYMLNNTFKKNYEKLEEKYGLKFVNGQLVSQNDSDSVDVDAMYDFSLNLA